MIVIIDWQLSKPRRIKYHQISRHGVNHYFQIIILQAHVNSHAIKNRTSTFSTNDHNRGLQTETEERIELTRNQTKSVHAPWLIESCAFLYS